MKKDVSSNLDSVDTTLSVSSIESDNEFANRADLVPFFNRNCQQLERLLVDLLAFDPNSKMPNLYDPSTNYRFKLKITSPSSDRLELNILLDETTIEHSYDRLVPSDDLSDRESDSTLTLLSEAESAASFSINTTKGHGVTNENKSPTLMNINKNIDIFYKKTLVKPDMKIASHVRSSKSDLEEFETLEREMNCDWKVETDAEQESVGAAADNSSDASASTTVQGIEEMFVDLLNIPVDIFKELSEKCGRACEDDPSIRFTETLKMGLDNWVKENSYDNLTGLQRLNTLVELVVEEEHLRASLHHWPARKAVHYFHAFEKLTRMISPLRLLHLDLSRCVEWLHENVSLCLNSIGSRCPSLEYLGLSGGFSLASEREYNALTELFVQCEKLKVVDLCGSVLSRACCRLLLDKTEGVGYNGRCVEMRFDDCLSADGDGWVEVQTAEYMRKMSELK
jgi:hypothetical protein